MANVMLILSIQALFQNKQASTYRTLSIIILTENVAFFFKTPIFDDVFLNIAPNVPFCDDIGSCLYILEYALVLWGNLLGDILDLYCECYSHPLLLKTTEKLHFCDILDKICPLFAIFCPFSHILHPLPPRLDYAFPIYLIQSFSRNFNRQCQFYKIALTPLF